MVDLSKLKSRRSGLGAPPPIEDASPNLQAPEHAPAHAAPSASPQRIDGRSARRSHRTLQFATRVSPEFDQRIRAIAARDGLMLVEVLERALDAYEASR
jgi:hypothetical protein